MKNAVTKSKESNQRKEVRSADKTETTHTENIKPNFECGEELENKQQEKVKPYEDNVEESATADCNVREVNSNMCDITKMNAFHIDDYDGKLTGKLATINSSKFPNGDNYEWIKG